MKALKLFLLVTTASVLWVTGAMADDKAGPPSMLGPTVVSQAKFPLTIQGAEYDLLTIVLDLASGAGVPKHVHGGSVLVTVLSGEITLKEKGAEVVKKAGESWIEKPGDEHSVINAGTATVRVVVSMLLPKGAEATTLVK